MRGGDGARLKGQLAMGIEIERKFLVLGEAWKQVPGHYLCQAYLSLDPARTVRVRIADQQAWLTIKGKSAGAARAEFEYAIPLIDAQQLLLLCLGSRIEKIRRVIAHAGLVWEVDEFLGENAPLVVAEVELDREDQAISKPDWVGAEVTQDPRYVNSQLVGRPFSSW